MEGKRNCSKTTATFLQKQVSALKSHHGQECDAKTVLQLLRMCPAMRSSVQLLLQALSPPPLLVARASSLLEQLTNCTRDLHREGGIQVRNNTEVWQDLVGSVEGIVSTVLQCIDSWLQKRQAELHNILDDVKRSLDKFKRDVQTITWSKNEVRVFVLEVIQKTSAALHGISQWESFIPDQRRKVLDVWLKQLYSVIQLLPRVTLFTVSLHQKCESEGKLSSTACVGLNVVISRLEEIINEVVTATTLEFHDFFSENNASLGNTPAPGAFLAAVDKVLDLLSSAARERELPRQNSCISGKENTCSAATKSASSFAKTEYSTTISTTKKSIQNPEFVSCGSEFSSTDRLRNSCDVSYTCATITNTSTGSTLLPSNEATPPLGQLLKVPLEEILRHVISIAYCSSPSDKKGIMSLCEEVLAHLKQLVNIESSESGSSGHMVDHAVGCECLAESVERLEQRAHTALIRCYVRTFADVTLPLDRLLHAVQSTVCSSTSELSPSSTLSVVQERVADLDERVDAIFQLAALTAASSVDQSRSSIVKSCLLTLEWLESVLVPVLLQPSSRLPSEFATECLEKHSRLLADHWRDAAVALRQCLDASLDPAAFVMVTQSEVHVAWWELKQKLYSQDVGAVEEPVARVLAMTARLAHLHQSDPFMVEDQREHLSKATNELQRSMKSVSTAPQNLRMRRSLLKRVQLMLTVVTRLSSSLHSTTLRDNTVLRHAMRPNIAGRSVLPSATAQLTSAQDSADTNWVATSDIGDIPLDVATPFKNIPRSSLRCKNPYPIDPSSIEKDSTAAFTTQFLPESFLERKISHQSMCEKQNFYLQKHPDTAMTADRITQAQQIPRSLSKTNSLVGSEYEVIELDPSQASPTSSSVLPDHSVVEHPDDQLRNLSAILKNDTANTNVNVAPSSVVSKFNDSTAEPPPVVGTNLDHLKSVNWTFGSVCDDTTLDITRLLASNTMDPAIRSSIRASMRSRLLKNLRGKHQSPVIKEVSVDLSGIISPATVIANTKVKNTGASKLLPRPLRAASCSDAVAQHLPTATSASCATECIQPKNGAEISVSKDALDLEVQRSQSDLVTKSDSLVQEITGLMENLSTFANYFSSSCTTVRPLQSYDASALTKSATILERNVRNDIAESSMLSDLDDPVSLDSASDSYRTCTRRKVDPNSTDAEMLQGIILHGASFSPQFPCIESTGKTSYVTAISENDSCNKENIYIDADSLREDFTTVVNTPRQTKMIDFTGIFSSPAQIMTSIIHEAEEILSDQKAPLNSSESLSDLGKISLFSNSEIEVDAAVIKRSPFRNVNNTMDEHPGKLSPSVGQLSASDSLNAKNDADVTRNHKTVSFKSSVASIATPDSIDVDTPQRLLDIQTLRTKLCKLKSMFRL